MPVQMQGGNATSMQCRCSSPNSGVKAAGGVLGAQHICSRRPTCAPEMVMNAQLELHGTVPPVVTLHLCCRMAGRCFWDNETDQYAFESFKNVSGAHSRCSSADRTVAIVYVLHAPNFYDCVCMHLHPPRPHPPSLMCICCAVPQESVFCVAAVFAAYVY